MKRRKKNKTKKSSSRSSKKSIRNRDGSKKDQVDKRQANVLPPGKEWVKSDMTWTDAVSTNDGNDINILSDSEYFGELKIERYQNQHNQTSMFCSLPDEILLMIFESFSISDIVTMATTCKTMAHFVSRNFVFKMLQPRPLSSMNQKKVNGRYLLYLKTDVNVTLASNYSKDEYLERVELLTSMELKRLQKLTLDAYEFCFGNNFPLISLPPLYFHIANHYLLYAKQLTHLHFSIDQSEESFQLVDLISETLPNLTKVVLNAAYFPDEDEINTEEYYDVPHEELPDEVIALIPTMTFNAILRKILENVSIKSLEITGLVGRFFFANSYPIKIRSSHLQYLGITHQQFGYFKDLTCPELREFKHVEEALKGANPGSNCLVHNVPFKDDYASLTTYGCPKLEVINGVDLKHVRRSMSDPESRDEWVSRFEDMCDCNTHEKRGMGFTI